MANSIEKLRAKKSTRKKEADVSIYDTQLDRPTLSNIQIDEELKSYIPPLKPDELTGLEASIRKEHVRDKLIVWQNEEGKFILVDGHNRFHILQKLHEEGFKISFQTDIIVFPAREAVKDWMINNQLSRRNLTSEQTSYLRGLRYNREKSRHGGSRKGASPQNEDLPRPSPIPEANSNQESNPQNEDLKTSSRLASEFKVAKATIERDGQYAMGLEKIGLANPELKRSILSGDIKLGKTIIQHLSKYNGSKKKLQSLNSIRALIAKPKTKSADNSDFTERKDMLIEKAKALTTKSPVASFQEAIDLLDEMKRMLQPRG